jgi:hypothetical protein
MKVIEIHEIGTWKVRNLDVGGECSWITRRNQEGNTGFNEVS